MSLPRVVVQIKKGKAVPTALFIDGVSVPGVQNVLVSYEVGKPRSVTIHLLAEEVVEEEPPEFSVDDIPF